MGNLIQTFPQNDNSDCMKKGVDYVTAGQKADTVRGERVTIEGGYNTASGNDAHAEGWETTASGGNAHTEGQQTVASTYNTHAEGKMTTASAQGAHSEGYKTVAYGKYSHAEGYGSSAAAEYSHAEGSSKVSSTNGTYAHAEGQNCAASASGAHAEGWNTEALGRASHTEGYGTIARLAYQHVQGKYNIPDTENLYAHIVGGGSASYHRSNIHTLDWSGNAWYAGDVNAGRSNGLTDDTKLPTGADVISYLDSNMSSSKTITGNPVVITDAANIEAEEVITNIEPIQDLHGYDYPWVGGAGKNQAYDVTYISTKNQYAPVIKTSYKLKQGKRYVISFYTANTNIVIYRETPTVLGFDSLSEYSFDCDGTRKSMYGTATADATISNVDIIKRLSSTSDVESGLCYDLQIEEVADSVTTPTDYAPYSNICPISGLDSVEVKRTGKNLFNEIGKTGDYFLNSNGVATANPNWNYTDYIPITGNSITMSYNSDDLGYSPSICFYDEYKNFISGSQYYNSKIRTFNVPINAKYFRASYFNSWISTFQLELGSTATEYEPSQLETHTTSLPQTTYGGTLNVQTGELVVDRVYNIIDGSKVTSVSPNSTTDTMGGKRLISTITDAKPTMGTVVPNIISDKLHVVTPDNIYSQNTPNVVSVNDIGQVVLRYQGASTLADAQTVLNNSPIQVVYEFATPQTYQLTSHQVKLLLNHNNISTNVNEISVKYQPNNNLGEILTVSEEYTDRKMKEEIKSSEDISGNPIIIEDSANVYAEEVIANIKPIQDLHGYDHPWVGGAGKNIQPLTVDGIKSVNTSATWTGNSITLSGVTFTIQTDSDDNVIGILANGDTTISSGDFVALNLPHPNTLTGNYIINGCPAGGGANTYIQRIGRTSSSVYYGQELGSGLALNNVNDIFTISIFVKHASNIVFKPMIRLATETDPTFEPYSNICPISGLNSVEVERIGKNLCGELIPNKVINYNSGIAVTNSDYHITDFIFIKKGQTVTIQNCTPGSENWIYDLNKTPLTRIPSNPSNSVRTYTSNIDCYIMCSVRNSDIDTFMIEEGSTATEYEPYQSETHTTSLPQTTYGGTLNVQTGEFVIDRVLRSFNGSEGWYANSRWPHSCYTVWTNDSKYTTSTTSGFGNYIQCNKYHGVAKQIDNIQNGEILFNVATISSVYASIIIKDENYSSVDDFKASLSSTPLQIVYELATPQTYYLTPEQVKLLKGYNYITTNADTLDITYQVDNVLGEILSESEKYIDRVIVNSNNAGYHNSIYRGKYLGETVTSDQYTAIGYGTFYDLFIGDYWIINDITWRIAAFDYWMRVGAGDQYKVMKHHVVIVPDQYLSRGARMNASSTTSGGYIATEMHTQTIPQVIDPIVENAFGSAHILVHSEMITDQVTNGVTTKYVQVDNIKSENMNEIAVYGSRVFGSSGYDSGNARGQLPLFRLNPDLMVIQGNVSRKLWWLRDIHNAQYFCYVNGNGYADKHRADNSAIPVRPYFAIKA